MTSCIKSWQSFFLRFCDMTAAVIIYTRSLQWVGGPAPYSKEADCPLSVRKPCRSLSLRGESEVGDEFFTEGVKKDT